MSKRIKNKARKRKRLKDTPISGKLEENIGHIAKTLARQVDDEVFEQKYAPVAAVLKLVAVGAFLAITPTSPNLPKSLRRFMEDPYEPNVWKHYNIPYLKQTLKRLEQQKLIKKIEKRNRTGYSLTNPGKWKILKYALDNLEIKKPRYWDGKWRLVTYDIPRNSKTLTDILRKYLLNWKFYPLQNSVYLHAYPCEKEVAFLRDFYGIADCVRIFTVEKIENEPAFREFFDV